MLSSLPSAIAAVQDTVWSTISGSSSSSSSSGKTNQAHTTLVTACAVGAAVATTAICGVYTYHHYLTSRRAGEVTVQTAALPILGDAIEFGKKPLQHILERSKRAKPDEAGIFGLLIAGKRMFFIKDPADFNVIFRSDKKELSFDVFTHQIVKNVFGCSAAAVDRSVECKLEDRARAQYQKHLLQDTECSKLTSRMQRKMTSMGKELRTACDQTGSAGEIVLNLFDFTNDFVYRASVASVFSESIADDKETFKAFMAFDSVFALAIAGAPVYNTTLSSLLGQRNAAAEGRERVVQHLMRAMESCEEFIRTRVDMYDESGVARGDTARYQLGMLWASAGNSMPACYWVLYFLLKHPAALAALRAELATVFGARAPSADLAVQTADLPAMKVLDSCISEALRLMSGSMMMRQVVSKEGCQITLPSTGKSYKFREGDTVGIFPAVVHFDEDFFPQPFEFHYDRFLKLEQSGATTIKRASDGASFPLSQCFVPFGGGASYCPGRKFARNEIKTVIAYLVANFHISFADSSSSGVAADWLNYYDGSRAGLGVFPPKDAGVEVRLRPLWA